MQEGAGSFEGKFTERIEPGRVRRATSN